MAWDLASWLGRQLPGVSSAWTENETGFRRMDRRKGWISRYYDEFMYKRLQNRSRSGPKEEHGGADPDQRKEGHEWADRRTRAPGSPATLPPRPIYLGAKNYKCVRDRYSMGFGKLYPVYPSLPPCQRFHGTRTWEPLHGRIVRVIRGTRTPYPLHTRAVLAGPVPAPLASPEPSPLPQGKALRSHGACRPVR